MKNLLLFASLMSLCLPAFADRDDDRDRGKPFDRLQEQIDKLNQRVQALEKSTPANQTCPTGQFVAGFNSADTILCATPAAETPTPPPPGAPIPGSIQDLVQSLATQQNSQGALLSGAPQAASVAGTSFIIQVTGFDMLVGQAQIAMTSASTAAITIGIVNLAVYSNIYTQAGGTGTPAATAQIFGSATVTVNVAIATSNGLRRILGVTSVDVAPLSLRANASDSSFNTLLTLGLSFSPVIAGQFSSVAETIFDNAVFGQLLSQQVPGF